MRRHEPTGRRTALDGGDVLLLERVLPAGVERCWAAFTTSAGASGWIGEIDGGREDARFRMTAESADAEWTPVDVEACAAPEHLAVAAPGPEGGAWRLDIRLAERGAEQTALRFAHRLDAAQGMAGVDWIAIGWEYYLDRLDAALSGGDVAAISWSEGGYEELRRGYADLFGLRADSDAAEVLDAARDSAHDADEAGAATPG